MRRGRLFAVLAAVVCCARGAAAQITELRDVGGKQITCERSGLMSNPEDCGIPDWYKFVFVGSIAAIKPVKNVEREIRIIPEEIYSGEPTMPLIVQTSQADCFPKISVGDRWLFFLRKEDGKPIVLDYYGNNSRPITDAQKQVDTLRRLQTIGDFAILRGSVRLHDGTPVPTARVVAHRTSDNAQFVATADADGLYEFQPLPPGSYKLTADRIGSFRPDDSEVNVHPGTCRDLTLSRSPHAEISGRVKRSDGSPMAEVPVLIVDKEGWTTTTTDQDGRFIFDSLRPGDYTIGIHLPGATPWKNGACGGAGCVPPPASLYYPGMQNKSDALVINLATDQKRDDINFIVPNQ